MALRGHVPAWLKAERKLFERKARREAAPKPKRRAKPEVRVDYGRDAVPADAPAGVHDALAALSMEHTDVRKQLDILRQTRGQRQVGKLIIPPHLRSNEPMSDDGVELRGDVAHYVRGPKEG